MGRTIPSWRMVVEAETENMSNFKVFLRTEDKLIFEDLMNQCKLYASYASTMASPDTELPLILSMLFAHHKMLWKLEKQLAKMPSPTQASEPNVIVSTPDSASKPNVST